MTLSIKRDAEGIRNTRHRTSIGEKEKKTCNKTEPYKNLEAGVGTRSRLSRVGGEKGSIAGGKRAEAVGGSNGRIEESPVRNACIIMKAGPGVGAGHQTLLSLWLRKIASKTKKETHQKMKRERVKLRRVLPHPRKESTSGTHSSAGPTIKTKKTSSS